MLLGNVFAHTPDGTPYGLEVSGSAERVQLAVEDGGSGIPADASLGRGSSGGGSTGLGLDIAASTATAGGGSLRFERSPSLGGARVVLDLPRAEDVR